MPAVPSATSIPSSPTFGLVRTGCGSLNGIARVRSLRGVQEARPHSRVDPHNRRVGEAGFEVTEGDVSDVSKQAKQAARISVDSSRRYERRPSRSSTDIAGSIPAGASFPPADESTRSLTRAPTEAGSARLTGDRRRGRRAAAELGRAPFSDCSPESRLAMGSSLAVRMPSRAKKGVRTVANPTDVRTAPTRRSDRESLHFALAGQSGQARRGGPLPCRLMRTAFSAATSKTREPSGAVAQGIHPAFAHRSIALGENPKSSAACCSVTDCRSPAVKGVTACCCEDRAFATYPRPPTTMPAAPRSSFRWRRPEALEGPPPTARAPAPPAPPAASSAPSGSARSRPPRRGT